MAKAKKVKLAIIGVGNMGSGHCNTVQPINNIELVAICDTNRARADEIAAKYHVTAFYDHKSLLKSKMADAVVVATPHYDHTTIGVDVLKAGLHLLVEKPISVHKADCLKLIAAHKNKKQVFSAMFNQRTDPHYIKLKELIDKGELGEILRVNWIVTSWFRSQRYYDSGGWRATWGGEGGGVLLNQCPHQLDLMTWLFGEPVTVRANLTIGKYHNIEVEDDVTAYLTYKNGATGVFITSTGEAPGTNRLEVTGTRGKVLVEGDKDLEFIRNEIPVDTFCKTTEKTFATPPRWNITIPIRGSGDQHKGILQNFADAITKGTKLIAPAAEGIKSVELANAMLYAGLNDVTVKMPLNATRYKNHLTKLIKGSSFVKKTVNTKTTDSDFANSF